MGTSKRQRVASPEESSEEHESVDESGTEKTGSIHEAALHTIWNIESAKEVLQMISKKPDLTVFAAIRSQWGKGLDLEKAANAHIEGMYESDYADPTWDGGIFGMLQETRQLAEKLLQVAEFDAAFFFAHAAAAMIRRCEVSEVDGPEEEKKVVEWAKALDMVMEGAVKGWRKQSGNGKKAKQDAATMVKLLDKGERAKGCDQEKWYPQTLMALRAWAQ